VRGRRARGGLDEDVARCVALCRAAGARDVAVATDAAQRARLWQGRKKAFGAMGRIAPHLVLQDAVVPRTRLPDVLARIAAIGAAHGVRVGNVFHAGDGNLHPNISYDARDPDESARVHAAMGDVMQACIDAGGTITGEHGVGLDKLPYMDALFDAPTLARCARCATRSTRSGARTRARSSRCAAAASGMRRRRPAAARTPGDHRAGRPLADRAPRPRRAARRVEASALVRDAAARGTRLRIVGRGDWLDAGRPVVADAALHLAAMRGIVEYVPGDLTLTAGAGTTLDEIARATRAERQFLALDPHGGDAGTLGATVATASAGSAGARLRWAARQRARHDLRRRHRRRWCAPADAW
jgi:FAD/FMN-containing dehydrogenase